MKDEAARIRNARPEELDEVAQLLKSAFQQYSASIPPQAWQFYLEDIMDVCSRFSESELIVAELDGRLVGAITLYLDPARAEEGGWPRGWAGLRLLGVDPDYRNRGIGHALMEECLSRCRRKGIKTVGLHTTAMMDAARKMYEKMGFKRAPRHDFHPRPGVTVMAYRLDMGKSQADGSRPVRERTP